MTIRETLYKSLVNVQGYSHADAKEKLEQDLPEVKITNTELSDDSKVRGTSWGELKHRHGMKENLENHTFYAKLDNVDKEMLLKLRRA